MTKRILSVVFSAFVLTLLSCRVPVEHTVASFQEDLTAIRSQVTAFQEAVRALDFAAAAEIMGEDVVVMAPNQNSLMGRAAWTEWVGTWAITNVTEYDIEIEDIHVSGDFAYVRGTFSETLSLEGVTEEYIDEGKTLQIWRKDAAGTWRVAVDSWSSNLPLPAPEGAE